MGKNAGTGGTLTGLYLYIYKHFRCVNEIWRYVTDRPWLALRGI